MTQLYGRLDPLYEAVRGRAPKVDAACVHHTPEMEGGVGSVVPTQYMRVHYRVNGPRRVMWDDVLGVYRWGSGPDAGLRLGCDADEAAERLALLAFELAEARRECDALRGSTVRKPCHTTRTGRGLSRYRGRAVGQCFLPEGIVCGMVGRARACERLSLGGRWSVSV
ncbi:hypothetical protein FXF68_17410 [Actinomadura decatromicini]|uniref:Uncharacterized protein n=1 Tax=Actinomadura decatromicini TaxID=2604572 RepID=A0A5D3FPC1_9ACTN|nr:hypothetical protein FXF68_17410 [Actinomadura decatromicini]